MRVLERGASVGRFLIVDRLGAGGTGVVYKAFDPKLDRPVLLKLLHAGDGDLEVLRDRLLREAQALGRLSHPNVVAVHDVGTFGGDAFVAMEFVEGATLSQWLEQAPRSQREILEAFRAAGRALAAAHQAGLVHRDFNPDNVIVGNDGRVRVAGAGAITGTPRFLAPEQHRGQSVDERADQFSFCVSLYFALHRRYPFAADSAEGYREAVLDGRIEEAPPGAKVPRWLRSVLLRGLAVRPEARWPSMQALLAALSQDPGRTLRRRVAAASAASIAAALLAGVVHVERAHERVCAGAEAKIAGAWDAARKQRMRDAFTRTHRPYAAQAFETASRALDAYARAWVAMRTSACQATRVRREQSEELLDLRMECLDQRQRELGALSELLTNVDEQTVAQAAQAAASLTPLDGCANAAALKAPVRLPRDPATLARVEALRERIARGHALWDAARDKEGLKWMVAVAEEAKTIPHLPTVADALDLYGDFQWRAGEVAAAEATLKEALIAAEGGHDDESAVRACTTLVRAWADRDPGSPEGLFWAKQAAAWLARLAAPPPRLETDLERAIGTLHYERGELAEADQHFRRQLEVAERAFGRDSDQASQALASAAINLYFFGQFAASAEYGERARAMDEKIIGREHPDLAVILSNLAAAYTELGRLDDAESALVRADQQMRPSTEPTSPWLGAISINLAEVYELKGREDDALRLLRATLADQKVPEIVADVTADLASVLNRQGRFALALPQAEKALAMQESLHANPDASLGKPLLGIALARLGLGQPARAIAPLARAEAMPHLFPRLRGRIRLALAQALEVSHRAEPPRVRALLTQARADLAPVPQLAAKELTQIDAWLARHP
jgi:tetratricopeptide (TPR) repeat protein